MPGKFVIRATKVDKDKEDFIEIQTSSGKREVYHLTYEGDINCAFSIGDTCHRHSSDERLRKARELIESAIKAKLDGDASGYLPDWYSITFQSQKIANPKD